MAVTVYPPSLLGTVIEPDAVVSIAQISYPPYIVALLLETV